MNAVESLIREHQIISRLADALEAYARRIDDGDAFDSADLARFAAFFTDFAECVHHEKEESILLPALSRHGSRWDTGVLPAVRREHRQEAYLIDVLRQAGERAGSWSNEDRRQITATARALVEFQRNHHILESTELFPLAALRLEADDLCGLQAALEKFDRDHAARRSSALQLGEVLSARYRLEPRGPRGPAGGLQYDGECIEASECCLGPDE